MLRLGCRAIGACSTLLAVFWRVLFLLHFGCGHRRLTSCRQQPLRRAVERFIKFGHHGWAGAAHGMTAPRLLGDSQGRCGRDACLAGRRRRGTSALQAECGHNPCSPPRKGCDGVRRASRERIQPWGAPRPPTILSGRASSTGHNPWPPEPRRVAWSTGVNVTELVRGWHFALAPLVGWN